MQPLSNELGTRNHYHYRIVGYHPPLMQTPIRPGMPTKGSGVAQPPVGVGVGGSVGGGVGGGVVAGPNCQPPFTQTPVPKAANGLGVVHPRCLAAALEAASSAAVLVPAPERARRSADTTRR